MGLSGTDPHATAAFNSNLVSLSIEGGSNTSVKKPVPFYKRDQDPFSGKRYYDSGYLYRRPDRQTLKEIFNEDRKLKDDQTEYRHRDVYGQITTEKRDVLRYISPTESVPRPLLVQATRDVYRNQPAGDWRRVKLQGNVPSALRVSEWALAPSHWLNKALRVMTVAPTLLVLLSLPFSKIWDEEDFQETYTEFPNYCWDYPKHARNRLDARPYSKQNLDQSKNGDRLPSLSNKVRLLRPRQLMVRTDDGWVLDAKPAKHTPYVFISFFNGHFPVRTPRAQVVTPECNAEAKAVQGRLELIAQARTEEEGLNAYWIDYECCAPDAKVDLHTADVHRMCDVIRGAHQVCVILPKLSPQRKAEWGSRMWTLPEALLTAQHGLKFCAPDGTSQTLSLLDMSDDVWDDGNVEDGHNQPTRLLAEHYSTVLSLGRLELFSIALEALQNRSQNGNFSNGDIAYALMGLLHNRIQLDTSDSLFQALAQLSLANDSDRLMERMVCMLPDATKQDRNIFIAVTEPDQFDTQLWDIEPLCQVAGVGQSDGELILDACRGVSIRWKAFPEMKYKRKPGFTKLVAEVVLRSGIHWAGVGLGLLIYYGLDLWDLSKNHSNPQDDASNKWSQDVSLMFLGTLAILFAFVLALFAPISVRRVYGSSVMQSTPWLVGFEGTMPIENLERIVFGNYVRRLTYEPSSTPFCDRDPDERIGQEPLFVTDRSAKDARLCLPKGHRLFTLVDTGALTVSIFSAVRPPSVALICGREGGMLRTVLCHYERSNNCLYKETVVRMDSGALNQAKDLSWIKFSMGKNLL